MTPDGDLRGRLRLLLPTDEDAAAVVEVVRAAGWGPGDDVAAALRSGDVMRTRPETLCGSYSPETHRVCRLEPGHVGAHSGFDPDPTYVSWA